MRMRLEGVKNALVPVSLPAAVTKNRGAGNVAAMPVSAPIVLAEGSSSSVSAEVAVVAEPSAWSTAVPTTVSSVVTVNKLATLFAQAMVTASATVTSVPVTTSATVTAPATSLAERAHRHAHNYD
jgi:hypothetical protein